MNYPPLHSTICPAALRLLLLFSCLFAVSARSQTITMDGIGHDGYGGVSAISGSGLDGGAYWWMCIEPTGGSTSLGEAHGVTVDALSLAAGWDRQNTERLTAFQGNPAFAAALPTQVRVMEYVLDTYLPWDLMGVSGRFAEQSGDSGLFGNDDAFYNSFFTIQNFIADMYGSPGKTDFTDITSGGLDPFVFELGNAEGNAASLAARQALFDLILDDVAAKSGTSFFDTYTVQGTYLVASSSFPIANNTDPLAPDFNWEDALIIVSPVPEPGGVLLIGCAGIFVLLRRGRKRTTAH